MMPRCEAAAGDDEPPFAIPPGQFQTHVSRIPQQYAGALDEFLNVSRVYQHSLIEGFTAAWKSEIVFDVENVFGFVSQILGTSEFWDEEHHEYYNYRNWLIQGLQMMIWDANKAIICLFHKCILILVNLDGLEDRLLEQNTLEISSIYMEVEWI